MLGGADCVSEVAADEAEEHTGWQHDTRAPPSVKQALAPRKPVSCRCLSSSRPRVNIEAVSEKK